MFMTKETHIFQRARSTNVNQCQPPINHQAATRYVLGIIIFTERCPQRVAPV